MMNRLGTYKTSTFSLLMAVAALAPCQTQASDRAVIEVRGESDAEVMWFRPNAVVFTNRDYRLSKLPEDLAGEKFLRSSIDSTEFDVVQGGRLIVATPHRIDGAASQVETLEAKGFAKMQEQAFQLFGSKEIDRVLVYEKQATSGESYRLGKWAVVLGF